MVCGLAVLRVLRVGDERHLLGDVNGEVTLLSVSVFQVCQTGHRSRFVCSCAAKVFIPVPRFLKVRCTVAMDTVAGLHGLVDQNSIPGGDRNFYALPRPALAMTY